MGQLIEGAQDITEFLNDAIGFIQDHDIVQAIFETEP